MTGLLPERRGWRVAAWGVLVFVAARFLLVLLTMRDPTGGVLTDSKSYMDLAYLLVGAPDFQTIASGASFLVRPPGYPVFLAGIVALFGDSSVAIVFFQLVLSGLCAVAMVKLGAWMANPRMGILAAWILALSPNFTLWSLTVMSEVLFTAALVLWMLLWVRATQMLRPIPFVSAGLVLAVSALIRPIGLLLVPACVVMTYLILRGRVSLRRSLLLSGSLLAAAGVVVAGWMTRNLVVEHAFTFTTVSSKTMIGFDLADTIARARGITRNEAAQQLESVGVIGQTFDVLTRYPVPFAKSQVLGIARTAAGTDIGTWGNVLNWDRWGGLGLLTGLLGKAPVADNSQAPTTAVEAILRGGLLFYSLLFTLGLLGLGLLASLRYRSLPGPTKTLVWFAWVMILVLVLSPLAAGQARFRVPAEPFLAILASLGLLRLLPAGYADSAVHGQVVPDGGGGLTTGDGARVRGGSGLRVSQAGPVS